MSFPTPAGSPNPAGADPHRRDPEPDAALRPCCAGWRRSRPDLDYCPACAQSAANQRAHDQRRQAQLLPIPPRKDQQ